MAPGKRFSKKEIKEDKLVTTAFRTSEYIQKNPTPFIVGGVIVGVLFAAVLLFMWSSDKKQTESDKLLARARIEMEMGQADLAVADLETLADSYPGSNAGLNGTLVLANYYFGKDDYENAKKYFEIAASGNTDDQLRLANANSGLAACYAMTGDYVKSAQYYKLSADVYPERIWAPEQLKWSIHYYIMAGDTASAISTINELNKKYETSTEAMESKKTLAELTY